VNLSQACQFQNVSNINIFECSQYNFGNIPPNHIIFWCEFTAWLDHLRLENSGLPVNIIDCLFPRSDRLCSMQFISKPCHDVPSITPEGFCANLFNNHLEPSIEDALFQDQDSPSIVFCCRLIAR
jgi:hypothetical protein